MTDIETWEQQYDAKFGLQYPFDNPLTQSNQIKDFIRTILQTEQTRIAEEVEKTSIEWEDSKDELYTYFGKCSCGETSVIVGSKYCYGCGKLIKNPLRSSEVLSIIKQDTPHEHVSDGLCYTSNPPQSRCIECGSFYR